jgi:hypothetical protein
MEGRIFSLEEYDGLNLRVMHIGCRCNLLFHQIDLLAPQPCLMIRRCNFLADTVPRRLIVDARLPVLALTLADERTVAEPEIADFPHSECIEVVATAEVTEVVIAATAECPAANADMQVWHPRSPALLSDSALG